MPTDFDASRDVAAASLAQLRTFFDAPLSRAAQQLIELGAVSDVRILQNGRIVTGIANDRHRVYVQYQRAGALNFEGECSCGERSPCVHVAAVMMTVATFSGAPTDSRRTDNRHTDNGHADNRHTDNGHTDNRHADNRQTDNGHTDIRRTDNDHTDNRHAHNRHTDNGNADNRRTDNDHTDNRHTDIRRTDNRRTDKDPSSGHDSPRPPESVFQGSAPLRQVLCYLIEPDDGVRGFKLSSWVAQTLAASGRIQPGARPFALRMTDERKDYPRYVETRDREILDALTARQFDGPWALTGAAGFDVLQRVLATDRAFWRSLYGRALREGGARAVPFAWQALPNGDQRLISETPERFDFLLELEPAVYIDTASAHCGPLELSYPVDLLRQYWNRAAVDPAEASALNAKLACEPRADGFPRLREMTIQRQARSIPRPCLVLAAGPAATVHFIYNGMAVDSESLQAEDTAVRRRDGDVVHEITRDPEFERQLHSQLDRFMIGAPRSGEAWLAFMTDGVPALRTLGWDITVEPEFPYRIAAADDWYTELEALSMRPDHPRGAKHPREWFDLRLGVMVDGRPVNLLPTLVQYLRGEAGRQPAGQHDALSVVTGEHLLVRLEDGRFLPLPLARIQRIVDTLVELSDHDRLNEHEALRLPATQAGRLAQLALESNAPALQSDDPTLLNLIDAVKCSASIEPLAAPAHFPATLRPYQEQGLGWLQFLRRHGLGGILADDMGLGKTVQTLAHLAIEKNEGRLQKPSLIVSPVSVLGNWQQELRRFTPELRLLILHGVERREAFSRIDTADVILIGYPLMLLDSEILLKHEFCFLILDEAQTIKNPRAKVSQVARALRAEHRLCLTGTPMENHLGELWSLFDFAQPDLLGERQEFQRHYRTPIEKAGDTRRAAALARRVQPFLLRRTKDGVARDLPPKIHIVEPIELDERQRDFYDGIRLSQHRRVREAIAHQGLARSHMTMLDALLKLRQACCDPRLISSDVQTQVIPSAKLDWLSSTLPELIAEGRRILLFSQFTAMLRLIEAIVKDLSIPYFSLTGETRQRTELVQRFQAGGVPLFLISLKAGGTGLNLTAADTIIHYDPWWNPAVEAQAADRAHRIGQVKPVFVYKLIAQRTVEEKIMQLQADKQALVTQIYPDESVSQSPLSSADLEALLAP